MKCLGRILHGEIELHPVVILQFETEIAVFDETVPAIFVEEDRCGIVDRLSVLRRYDGMPLKLLKAEALAGGEEAFDAMLYGLLFGARLWLWIFLLLYVILGLRTN